MASSIDVTKPEAGQATTASVRSNFQFAKDEIEALQTGKQDVDATLTSLAALGTAADKFAYTTGIDTWAEAAITAAGRAILDDASAAAQRTTLGVVIGTDVQAHSAVLDATTASYTTALNTKLSGIEALADVTDTANVTAAGALMDSELTDIAAVKAIDQDLDTTATPTFGPITIDPATVTGQTPNASMDDLVIDSTASNGISLLTANSAASYYAFGDTDNNFRAALWYNHATDEMSLRSAGSTRFTQSATAALFTTTITANGAAADVTGSRGGNAALADLLTELATIGLITDSTTA